jgi:hypothetical protein
MKIANLFAGVALACTIPALAAGAPPAAKPRASEHATKPQAAVAEPAQQEVAYADLGKYIGKRIIVHTKFNTTRSGALLRQSASQIDLKLDSGADLSIPVESIKHLGVPIGAPDPLFQTKPAEAKASDAKASGAKPADAKPATDTKHDAKPPATKPADAKPAESKTGDDSAKKK